MSVQQRPGTSPRLVWIVTAALAVSTAAVLLTAVIRNREPAPQPVDPAPSSTPPSIPAAPLLSVEQLSRLPEATTDTTIPAAPVDAHRFAGTSGTVVHNRQPAPVFAVPGGKPFARLPVKQLGNLTWLPVIGEEPGWLQVLLPSRPNSSTGWLQVSTVTLAHSRYEIRVSLADARLRLLRDGQQTGSWRISTGTAKTPTPAGRTFLLASITDPEQTFSPVILPLGAHSTALDSYAGGPGTVGIHGWPRAQLSARPSSHGCIRVPDNALHALTSVPLGSLVRIYQR